jgi:hypothetical protein
MQLTGFEKHDVGLTCFDHREANFDISIEGLGWFSIQGKGFVNLNIVVPPGIKFHVRDDPLCKFEVIDKGLKRYNGNTVNAHTSTNKKLA